MLEAPSTPPSNDPAAEPAWPVPAQLERHDAIGPSAAPAHRRRGDVAMVIAAAVLSAAMASGITAALAPRTSAPATAASGTGATATASTAGVVAAAANTTSSVAGIVASDKPAVVTIETTVTTQGTGRRGGATGNGVGSGFIYAANGYILTAAHVVEGASQITVTLADGRTFPGTVASSNATLDVAVVKIAATGLPTIPLGTSSTLKIGQMVLAIGDPLGQFPDSVTVGIVSGVDRAVTVADDLTGQPRDLTGLIQTDAAINQGNSGGPLIDASGAAVGIVNAGSSSAQGIAFAIPIDAAASVLAAAKTV